MKTLLFLDAGRFLWVILLQLNGAELNIIPEVKLDGHPIRKDEKIHVSVDQTLEPFGSRMSVYDPSPTVLGKIHQLTHEGAVDIVVIGNNNGSGMNKAQKVAEHLRERSVIIWNNYVPGKERPYLKLGYNRFISRHELHVQLRELLGLS